MDDLSGGRVLYDGHHQAIRLGGGTLVLNLDRVRAEFYTESPLLDVVGNAFVRVTHRITNLKEIVGVSDTSACSTMINVNESSMSVEQYFQWPPVYLVCRCVAASLDRHSSTYAARLAVPSGHNDFSHLPQLLWELFIQHYKHTRRQPKHVVYYRSGVSSSRVGDVVQAEMRSLRKAFRMLATNYEPHVTFIVANSHHHVRLFVSE
ncbi:hypothetical protein PC120_g19479 [Phytophthora cactorum]|nr:hypothetical protein PC120_g19479 [Phytophthora cactorum]